MTVPSPLLEQCFEEAVRHAAPMLGRCIDVGVSSLQAEEKDMREVAARDRAARSWFALLKHRNGWGPNFAQRLKAAFHTGYNEGNTSSLALLSNTELLALVERMLDQARSAFSQHQEQASRDALLSRLTTREAQVLERIVAGRLNKQIADDLGISIKTVEAHRANIMEKLNANTVADLLKIALGQNAPKG